MGPGSRPGRPAAFVGTTWRRSLKRRLAMFAVGEARFLQIEVAFDSPPRLVGDPAVAQQDVDEFPLRRDQLPRQLDPRRRDIVRVGVKRVRQLVDADLMPRTQKLD